MTEGFIDEKNDGACCAAVRPEVTWDELKETAFKLGAGLIKSGSYEGVCFGDVEFYEDGEVWGTDDEICPRRSIKQMKIIIENMFGE